MQDIPFFNPSKPSPSVVVALQLIIGGMADLDIIEINDKFKKFL